MWSRRRERWPRLTWENTQPVEDGEARGTLLTPQLLPPVAAPMLPEKTGKCPRMTDVQLGFEGARDSLENCGR